MKNINHDDKDSKDSKISSLSNISSPNNTSHSETPSHSEALVEESQENTESKDSKDVSFNTQHDKRDVSATPQHDVGVDSQHDVFSRSDNPRHSDIPHRHSEALAEESQDNIESKFNIYTLIHRDKILNEIYNINETKTISPYELALNMAIKTSKPFDIELDIIVDDRLYAHDESLYIVRFDEEVAQALQKHRDKSYLYIFSHCIYNILKDYINAISEFKDRTRMVFF